MKKSFSGTNTKAADFDMDFDIDNYIVFLQ